MKQSQDNEVEDKNNLEKGSKWAKFELNYFFFGCNNHQFLLDIIAVDQYTQNHNLMIQSSD